MKVACGSTKVALGSTSVAIASPRHAVALLAFVVAGCTFLSPRHDPSRFYTLSPRSPAAIAPAARDAGPSVVVGPVTFPAYLDRNEVAVRVSPSELKYATAERWAEPLVQNFTRILVENLSSALGERPRRRGHHRTDGDARLLDRGRRGALRSVRRRQRAADGALGRP